MEHLQWKPSSSERLRGLCFPCVYARDFEKIYIFMAVKTNKQTKNHIKGGRKRLLKCQKEGAFKYKKRCSLWILSLQAWYQTYSSLLEVVPLTVKHLARQPVAGNYNYVYKAIVQRRLMLTATSIPQLQMLMDLPKLVPQAEKAPFGSCLRQAEFIWGFTSASLRGALTWAAPPNLEDAKLLYVDLRRKRFYVDLCRKEEGAKEEKLFLVVWWGWGTPTVTSAERLCELCARLDLA